MIAYLYGIMDKRPLRALSLVMALLLAGCIFWDPSRFAAKTSELEIWHGFLIMWAVCGRGDPRRRLSPKPYTGRASSAR